jgi:hypothetical protein
LLIGGHGISFVCTWLVVTVNREYFVVRR